MQTGPTARYILLFGWYLIYKLVVVLLLATFYQTHAAQYKADASTEFDLIDLDGTLGITITGLASSDYLGLSVGRAGDFNNDSIDDVVIGAPYADFGGKTDCGIVYVIFGSDSWSSQNL